MTVGITVGMTVEEGLNKVFIEIEKNNKITIPELQNATGLSRRGVEWNLKKLKDDKLIKRIGNNRTGFWQIIKKI